MTAAGAAARDTAVLWVWRHPRPAGADGRCIGRTDLGVDRRKARRLAGRIERAARAAGLPRVVVTSTLRRSAEVGRCLRRRGWVHRIDARLVETDFGAWEGRRWAEVPRAEIDAWCADFARHAPGGGEPLQALLRRVAAWRAAGPVAVVGHAGWMTARRWLAGADAAPPEASRWPRAPRHGELWLLA